MKVYKVVVVYYVESNFVVGTAYYIVQAQSESDAINKAVTDCALVVDNAKISAKEIDLSRAYFLMET